MFINFVWSLNMMFCDLYLQYLWPNTLMPQIINQDALIFTPAAGVSGMTTLISLPTAECGQRTLIQWFRWFLDQIVPHLCPSTQTSWPSTGRISWSLLTKISTALTYDSWASTKVAWWLGSLVVWMHVDGSVFPPTIHLFSCGLLKIRWGYA